MFHTVLIFPKILFKIKLSELFCLCYFYSSILLLLLYINNKEQCQNVKEATLVITEFIFIGVSKERHCILAKYLVAVVNEKLCQLCHLQIQTQSDMRIKKKPLQQQKNHHVDYEIP